MAVEHYYIHSVVNEIYKDLDTGDNRSFFVPFRSDLNKYGFSNDCLTNGLGPTYCYFTLRDESNYPIAFFSKCAEKKKAISACCFTQSTAWSYQNELFHEDFENIFHFGFLSEDQVDAYAAGDKSVLLGKGEDNPLLKQKLKLEIHPEAIRAIMYQLMMRWLMGDTQVKIAVPKREREHYDAYVLSAVEELYSYFPSALRSEAGFSSYLPSSKFREMQRIYIIFVPEEDADSTTVFLDGSTPGVYRKLTDTKGLLPAIKTFIDHIASLSDPGERKRFLDTVFYESSIENGGRNANINPMRYKECGNVLGVLDAPGSVLEKLTIWIDFAAKGPGNLPEMERLAWEKINENISYDAIYHYAETKCADARGIEEKIESATAILPVCRDKSECRTALWDYIKNSIEQCTLSVEQIYGILLKKQDDLKTLSEDKYFALKQKYAEKCTETIIRSINNKIHELKSSSPDLQNYRESVSDIIKKSESDLRNFLAEEDSNTVKTQIYSDAYGFIVQAVSKNLAGLKRDVKTPEEIKTLIQKIDQVLMELEPVWSKTDEYNTLLKNAQQDRTDLVEKLNQSGNRLSQLITTIEESDNYFAAFENVNQEKDLLSEDDQIQLRRSLTKKKPSSFQEYANEYKNVYGDSLTTSSITERMADLQSQIVSDCRDFFKTDSFAVDGKSPEMILEKIGIIDSLAKQYGAGVPQNLTLFGRKIRRNTLERLLSFSLEWNEADGDEINGLVRTLAEKGVFQGKHVLALEALYENCGYKLGTLFDLVTEGKFQNTNDNIYSQYYRTVAEKVGKTDPDDGIKKLNSRGVDLDWDPTAQKAFKKVEKELRKKPETPPRREQVKDYQEPKRGAGKLIPIIILSVLLLASAASNAFLLLRKTPEPEPTPVPEEVEEPDVYEQISSSAFLEAYDAVQQLNPEDRDTVSKSLENVRIVSTINSTLKENHHEISSSEMERGLTLAEQLLTDLNETQIVSVGETIAEKLKELFELMNNQNLTADSLNLLAESTAEIYLAEATTIIEELIANRPFYKGENAENANTLLKCASNIYTKTGEDAEAEAIAGINVKITESDMAVMSSPSEEETDNRSETQTDNTAKEAETEEEPVDVYKIKLEGILETIKKYLPQEVEQ